MSTARRDFCERIGAARRAVTAFNLQDLPLSAANHAHNASVRIVRNGLAVQCFSILEDFAKARVGEVLTDISASTVQFRFLPVRFQEATVLESIRALNFRLSLLDKSAKAEKISYGQQFAAKIASTATSSLQLAEVAFFHSRSNITKEQFRDSLADFAVESPWTQMSGLCSRSGLSPIPAETLFASLASRRHSAAHNAAAGVSQGDLMQSFADATALAVSFDILLSKAAERLKRLTSVPPPTYRSINNHLHIPLRFILPNAGRFSELKEGSTRSIRTGVDANALIPNASLRSKNEDGALIVFEDLTSVSSWFS